MKGVCCDWTGSSAGTRWASPRSFTSAAGHARLPWALLPLIPVATVVLLPCMFHTRTHTAQTHVHAHKAELMVKPTLIHVRCWTRFSRTCTPHFPQQTGPPHANTPVILQEFIYFLNAKALSHLIYTCSFPSSLAFTYAHARALTPYILIIHRAVLWGPRRNGAAVRALFLCGGQCVLQMQVIDRWPWSDMDVLLIR